MAWTYGDVFEFDLKKDYIDIKKGHYTLKAIGFCPYAIEFVLPNGKKIDISYNDMDNLKELNGKLKGDNICDYDYQSIYDDEYPY